MALGALGSSTTLAVGTPTASSETHKTTTTTITTAHPAVGAIALTRTRLNVVAGRRALVTGVVRPARSGSAVLLQRRTAAGWRTVDRTRTRADGRFRLRFRPRRTGSAQLRVRAQDQRRRVGRLNVYRRASVSWYGPGLYGNRLGCGGRLAPGTIGVAHKHLPCGTRVTLRHHGRVVRVRVIDRGPYVGGREYDLTAATGRRLRVGGASSILVTR